MRLIDADALEREGWSLCRTFQKDKDTMVHEVKKLSDFPTIEQPHWIPCSERLPEIGEYVLTCISGFEDGCMGIDFLEKHIGGLHWMNDHGDLTDLEAITAWMPLPEPFEEVEE